MHKPSVGRGLLGAAVLGVLVVVALISQVPRAADPETLTKPVELDVDIDDDTFFNTGKRIGKVGDSELELANSALKKGDLRRADRYAEHAVRAYRKADANNRLEEARAVVGSVSSALKSAARVKSMQLQAVVARARHVQEVKADMAKREVNAETLALHASASVEQHKSAAAVDEVPRKEGRAETSVTSLDGTAPTPTTSDPKVLDCGPLGANCHDGEFYANQAPLTADGAVAKAEERLAAKKGISACDACTKNWNAKALSCVVDRCGPSAPHVASAMRAQSLSGAVQQQDKALKAAMTGLDWKQIQLNNARAELFDRFVGARGKVGASKVILVSKYAAEWVPEGSSSVKSWLDLSLASGSSLAALGIEPDMTAAVTVTTASGAKETVQPARDCVSGGLTLEQAMAPLNEEQISLNTERQQVVAKMMDGKLMSAKTPVVPVLLRWQPSSEPTPSAEAGKTQDLAMSATPVAAKAAPVPVATAAAGKEKGAQAASASNAAKKLKMTKAVAARAEAAEKASAPEAAKRRAAEEAKLADDSEGGKLPAADRMGNELPEVDAAKARSDLSSFFDKLIGRRVAVGRARVIGGGLAAKQQTKAELRKAEDAELGAKQASAAKEAHGAPVVGNELVHGQDAKTAGGDIEAYFDGLIAKKVAVGDGGTSKAAKEAVAVSELHNKASHAAPATAAAAGRGGGRAPVVGNELKDVPDSKASGDLENYFDNLVRQKVAVADTAERKAAAKKGSKVPFVGNELKKLAGLDAHEKLASYFNKIIHGKIRRKTAKK